MTKKKPGRKKKVGAKPVPLHKRHVWTLAELRARCGAEGDDECWDNYHGRRGQEPRNEHQRRYPVVVHGGVIRVMVRRLAWFLAFGEDPPDGSLLLMTKCSNPRCQNPYHATPMFEKQKCERAAKSGNLKSNLLRRLKLARSKQATGKLDWQKVRAIRASTASCKDEPWREFGISSTMWRRIRAGKAWIEFDNVMQRMAA